MKKPKVDKTSFYKWYIKHARQNNLNLNPYDPKHFYDYEAAFKAGDTPKTKGEHFPSKYKKKGHPTKYKVRSGQIYDTSTDEYLTEKQYFDRRKKDYEYRKKIYNNSRDF